MANKSRVLSDWEKHNMAKQRQYGTRILEEKEATQYCFYCGKKMKERNKTIDHITPIKKGGSNCFSNNPKLAELVAELKQLGE